MPSVTLGVIGNLDYARGLGKKGTESDVQLCTFKEGDVNVSLVVPFRHPEKVQPLAYAVNAGDGVLIVVKEINRELGEGILAAAAAGHTKGLVVLQEYVQPEQVKPLLRGTTLDALPVLTDDKPALVRQHIAQLAPSPREGPVQIPVDHHFHVKGVGTVVLGFVEQGVVRKHDTLRAYPTTKTCQVRSIQVHDVDVAEARTGDHVGLALKGIENDDLDRGFILAPDGSLLVAEAGKELRVQASVSPFYKAGIKRDVVYALALGWQIVPARAKDELPSGKDGALVFEPQKPLVHNAGDRALVLMLDAPQRVVGHVIVG